MNAAKCLMGLLWVALCTTALGKDVVLYKLSKGIQYQQTLSGPPTVLTENGYVFEAQVLLPLAGTVTSADVKSSEGTLRVLTLDSDTQWEFRNRVNTPSTLDTRYPEGPFIFTINPVHDGGHIINLPITGDTYPAAPRISDLPQLQAVNAHGYAVVRWDVFGGGGSQDFVQLRIEDANGNRIFETRDFGEIGALDGSATYAIVPPETLKPGKTYEATLRFDKTSAYDTSSYLGAPGWSTHHAVTRFAMVTSLDGTPEVETYGISKGQRFEQTTLEPPVRDANDEYYFSADVDAKGADSVLSALLTSVVGEPLLLLTEGDQSSFSDKAQTQELLDAAYPNGTYGFGIETALSGTRSTALTIGGDVYPPTPYLWSFNPSQAVRADQNLVFEWQPWAGGSANDFIQLHIEDDDGSKVFETKDFGENGALHGAATWTMVPAGIFEPGKDYKARLVFTRFIALDDTSYPGALGTASYYSRTKFAISVAPPDVAGFSIGKGREFRQTGPSTVVSSDRWSFNVMLSSVSTGTVNSVSLNIPGVGTVPLVVEGEGQVFSLAATRSTKEALDSAFPNGTYQFVINAAHDGLRTINVELTGDAYPNAPMTDQYDATAQIFPFFDFTISWVPFAGGRSKDFIQFEIVDRNGAPAFRTGDYRQPDSMGGQNLAAAVPADYVQPNAAYVGHLHFETVNSVEDPAYAGVSGRSGYSSDTRWNMATLGDGNPTSFTGWSRASDGSVEFEFATVPGASYVVEGSSDLVNWTLVTAITPNDERTTVRFQPAGSHYFYRAVLTR